MEEGGPALLIDAARGDDLELYIIFVIRLLDADDTLCRFGMHQRLRVEWRLREQTVSRWDAEDTAKSGGGAEQDNVPGETTGLARAVAVDGANDAANLMIEEEEDGDDEPRDDGCKDPSDGKMPELDEEGGSIGIAWSKGVVADLQGLLVKTSKLAHMRHADEDDDGDGGGILGQTHSDIAMEEWGPALRGGEEDGDEHGADCTDDGVEEGSKGEGRMSALELLNGFVKVDDAVEERENLGRECGHVSHGPVVGVEDGEDVVHPAGVDQRPGHEWEKRYIEGCGAKGVDIFGQNGKRSRHSQNGQGLD